MVGDTTTDVEAGRRAGLRTVLVRTGHAGLDGKHPFGPDYVATDLSDAVSWILDGHRTMCQRLAFVASAALVGRLVLVGGLARSGKSRAAQVLKELLAAFGRTAHVLSLDSWLKPAGERTEGAGVLSRFDVDSAVAALAPVVASTVRCNLSVPVYDRSTRRQHLRPITMSVGADDVLIVEGVPALLIPALGTMAALKVHLDVPEADRVDRLRADYGWRGYAEPSVEALLESRSRDETVPILEAAKLADFVVSSRSES
jgi:uridine kinase